ncbi:MAG: V-type ATP synthase subunit I [Treponema sp.]|jgi:V/A-type H+-transporting ATPase subunit I|nr:V-type ATP synthase subunit I [Treponema sp.]
MIVPMKKVCIMVQKKSRDEAILKLADVGVVHLEKSNAPVDINSNAQKLKIRVEEAMGLIQDYKTPKPKKPRFDPNDKRPISERRMPPAGMHRGRRASDVFGTDEEAPYSIDAVMAPRRPYLPDMMNGFGEERKQLRDQNSVLSREISRIEGWGDFDPSIINEISERLPVFLYELTHSVFENLDKDVEYIKVKSDKTFVRIIVFENKLQGLNPFAVPEKSLSALLREMEINNHALKQIEDKIKSFADRRPALHSEMAKVEQYLEYETALSGMHIEDGESDSTSLSWLTGYIPSDDFDKVKRTACANNWALSVDDPNPADENVPTKIKNNGFVSLLKPVTDFLNLVPGYHEVDISPFFLIFFCIFFGMIYGDAVYGIVLTLMGLFGIIAIASKKKPVPLAMPMLVLLGLFNVAWGVLTCAWLGMSVDAVPQILRDISFSYFSTAKTPPAFVSQNIQIFCFSLGLIHLTCAHLLNFFRFKSLRKLGEIGSIAMLVGMYNVVLTLIVSNKATREIPLLPVALYLIAGGFVLSFFFSAYEKSIGQAIKASLSNIISVILGIVNVFSDIMSYIRLWAVGLAGAAIAETVNILAGPMLGSFLIFFGIVLLVFGHGLNMVINVLAVLVHGVRLNTLEFSGHVSLTWAGKKYMPFGNKK